MKHPYHTSLSLYAMKLTVPWARWDTHKMNSIENSIWEPDVSWSHQHWYHNVQKPPSTFQPEQSALQRPPPWKQLWKIIFRQTWRCCLSETFYTEHFLLDAFRHQWKQGTSFALFIFSFHIVTLALWSFGVPSDDRKARNILCLQATFEGTALMRL